jgi:hypothetical protein
MAITPSWAVPTNARQKHRSEGGLEHRRIAPRATTSRTGSMSSLSASCLRPTGSPLAISPACRPRERRTASREAAEHSPPHRRNHGGQGGVQNLRCAHADGVGPSRAAPCSEAERLVLSLGGGFAAGGPTEFADERRRSRSLPARRDHALRGHSVIAGRRLRSSRSGQPGGSSRVEEQRRIERQSLAEGTKPGESAKADGVFRDLNRSASTRCGHG